MQIEAEFWAKVEKGPTCWLWAGALDSRGYGNLKWRGKGARAHRVAYTLARGKIPEGDGHHGIEVMHSCDVRRCCRPSHLVLGTHDDNMADMAVKGRRKAIAAGEANGRAVLSLEDVERIRLDPRGTRKIAKDYPVSRSAIQRIKTEKAWANF